MQCEPQPIRRPVEQLHRLRDARPARNKVVGLCSRQPLSMRNSINGVEPAASTKAGYELDVLDDVADFGDVWAGSAI